MDAKFTQIKESLLLLLLFFRSFIRSHDCLLIRSIASYVVFVVAIVYSDSTFLCTVSDIDTSIVWSCIASTVTHKSIPLKFYMQILHINSILNRFVCHSSLLFRSLVDTIRDRFLLASIGWKEYWWCLCLCTNCSHRVPQWCWYSISVESCLNMQ